MIFLTALRKELLEQRRTYRLLIVLVVLVSFGLMSPLLARYTKEILTQMMPEEGPPIAAMIPEPTLVEAVAQYVKNISQFIVILALLMTMGSVALEKDKGTAALMLAKPMPRAAFLLAKFVAVGLTFAAGLAAAAVAGYYYTWILFEPMDIARWLALNGLLFVFTLVYVALTLACSAATRSQVAAGGMAFGLLILLAILGAIPALGRWLPGQLLAWCVWLFTEGAQPIFSMDVPSNAGPAWPALGVSLGLIAAALAGAWALFRRQEL